MNLLLAYDIAHDRTRNRMAKTLLRNGLIRIQKSVFMGRSTQERLQKIVVAFFKEQEHIEPSDSVIILPLTRYTIDRLTVLNGELDTEFIFNEKEIHFF